MKNWENSLLTCWSHDPMSFLQKHRHCKAKRMCLRHIENKVKAHSGMYCCHIEQKGWFIIWNTYYYWKLHQRGTSVLRCHLRYPFTCAPLMPAPTENHKPVATSPSPTESAETLAEDTAGNKKQPISSTLHSCSTNGNGKGTETSNGLQQNKHKCLWNTIFECSALRDSVGISI